MTATRTKTHPDNVALTAEIRPTDPEGRIKRVMSESDVAHRWANLSQWDAKTSRGNFYYHGGTIYSYGSHFPIASHVVRSVRGKPTGERFILFTSRSYSPTTAGHKAAVRSALPGNIDVFEVPNVCAKTRGGHRRNFQALIAEAVELKRKSLKARQNKAIYLDRAAGTLAHANRYAEAVGLKERVDDIEGAVKAAEQAKRLQTAADKRRLLEQEKRRRKQLEEQDAKLAAWTTGGDWPYYGQGSDGFVRLRLKGSRIVETSKRIAFPLAAAVPILTAIRTGLTAPIVPGGEFELDGYKGCDLDHEKRTVTMGCHVVAFDEVERIAKLAGL